MDSTTNKIPKSHKEIISKLNSSKFKKNIITEINRARSDPNSYLLRIQEILNAQHPKEAKNSIVNINGVHLRLYEGISVLESAIEFLKTQKKVQRIKLLSAMDSAANELLEHLISTEGLIDSEQILYKDIYDPETRLNKHGKCFGAVDEIIDCGCFDAELLVISLIIGDGDENRLERNTLFLEEFKFAGIATRILAKSERICTVINICEEFISPGEYVPKSQRKVRFCGNDNADGYEQHNDRLCSSSTETVNNKLYLSKKFYENTEIIEEETGFKNFTSNKNIVNNNDDEYSENTISTKFFYDASSEEKSECKNRSSSRNINAKNSGLNDRRKSSLLTYKNKKNSIDKFISFFNDQERYLDTVFEKMGKEFEEGLSDNYSSDGDDCYECCEVTEETTTSTTSKKVTSRTNKKSIVSFNEIEELEKEKNDLIFPQGVFRITWDERKFIDPIDKKAYFIVEKNSYKSYGEVIRVVYTKY